MPGLNVLFFMYLMYLYSVCNLPGWLCCSMQGNIFKPAWKASSSVEKVLYSRSVT